MTVHVSTLKGQVDAVILTIRKDEDDAVAALLGKLEPTSGGRSYRVARIPGAGRDLTVALLRLLEAGNGPAQDAARDAIHELEPRMVTLVGISGAVPAPEFTLGDVMLATRVSDLRVQALVPDSPPQLEIRGDRVHKKLADRLSNLIELPGWAEAVTRPRPPAPLDPNLLKGSESWNKKISSSLEGLFHASGHRQYPVYFTGTIGSSDFLVKDATALAHWLQSSRKIETIEMEAVGVMEAAARPDATYPVLVVRGISDIVGYERNPAWTAYACQSAAAFAIAILRSGQLDEIRPYRLEQPDTKREPPRSAAVPNAPPVIEGLVTMTVLDGLEPFPDKAPSSGLDPRKLHQLAPRLRGASLEEAARALTEIGGETHAAGRHSSAWDDLLRRHGWRLGVSDPLAGLLDAIDETPNAHALRDQLRPLRGPAPWFERINPPFEDDSGCLMRWALPLVTRILSLAVSLDGARIVAGAIDGRIWSIDSRSGVIAVCEGPPRSIYTPLLIAGDMVITGVGAELVLLAQSDLVEVGRLQGHNGDRVAATWDQQTQVLYSSGDDGTVKRWDVARRGVVWSTHAHEGKATAVAIAAGGSVLSVGSSGHLICLDASTGQRRYDVHAHEEGPIAVAAHGDLAVTLSGGDGAIKVWRVGDGQCLQRRAAIDCTPMSVHPPVLNHDATCVAVLGGSELGVYALPTLTLIGRRSAPFVEGVRFGRGDANLWSWGKPGLHVWDPAGEEETELVCHGEVVAMDCDPDGTAFVLARETFVELRRPSLTTMSATLWPRRYIVPHVEVVGPGDRILLNPGGLAAAIIDLAQIAPRVVFQSTFLFTAGTLSSVASVLGGAAVVASTTAATIRELLHRKHEPSPETDCDLLLLLDLASGRCTQLGLNSHHGRGIDDRGRRLWVAYDTETVVWDLERVARIGVWPERARSVAFYADARRAVSCGPGGVLIWDVSRSVCTATLKLDPADCKVTMLDRDTVAIWPASGYGSKSIEVWNLPDCKRTTVLTGGGDIQHVCSAGGGRALSLHSWGRSIAVWSTTSGRLLRRLDGHHHRVEAVVVLPDGNTAVSWAESELRVWEIGTGRCLTTWRSRLKIEAATINVDRAEPRIVLVCEGEIVVLDLRM